jgi:hypothetical protein
MIREVVASVNQSEVPTSTRMVLGPRIGLGDVLKFFLGFTEFTVRESGLLECVGLSTLEDDLVRFGPIQYDSLPACADFPFLGSTPL